MMFFTTLLSALALAASTTTATPITERGALLAVAPTITSPAGGEVWQVGSWQTVAWDTLDIPAEALNYTAEIFLGFSDGETPSENLFCKLLPTPTRHRNGDLKTHFFCMYVQPYMQPIQWRKAFGWRMEASPSTYLKCLLETRTSSFVSLFSRAVLGCLIKVLNLNTHRGKNSCGRLGRQVRSVHHLGHLLNFYWIPYIFEIATFVTQLGLLVSNTLCIACSFTSKYGHAARAKRTSLAQRFRVFSGALIEI
jgi:hypothetical protein